MMIMLLTSSQIREPMPAVYFFLIDVSMNAMQIGATAAACSAVSQVISELPVSFIYHKAGLALLFVLLVY